MSAGVRRDNDWHRRLPGVSALDTGAVRRLTEANSTLAGYRLRRFMPDAIEDVVVHGRGDPDAIRTLCRAAVYLAYYDGARRVTSEHVGRVVRLRDGDGAHARQDVAGAQGASTLPARSSVFRLSSAARHSSALLGVAAVICIGAWMASTPEPAPSGSPPGSEPRAMAAGALASQSLLARPGVPASMEPADAMFPTPPTSLPATATGTTDPVFGAAAPDAAAQQLAITGFAQAPAGRRRKSPNCPLQPNKQQRPV